MATTTDRGAPPGNRSILIPMALSPGGVREDLTVYELPKGTWLAASNFLSRQGYGRPRPGYTQVETVDSADRIIGFGFRGASTVSTNLVVQTLTAAYNYNGSTFTDITGTWAASDPDDLVRFTTFASGGTLYLVRVNFENPPDIWSGTGSFTSPVGSPPAARDLCTTNSRIILAHTTDSPYQCRWNDPLDINTWPTGTNYTVELSETQDEIVGCAAFGPLSAAIYKEDSVWLTQAVVNINPFQFQLIGFVPGPVSAAAIVPYLGHHYWLAKDGTIYRFDGTRFERVSAALITTFRETFQWNNRLQTHGCVLGLQDPEIWWFYPSGVDGNMRRAMCLNVSTGALTPHTFADEITASASWLIRSAVSWDDLTGTWDTLGTLYPTWSSMGSQAQPTCVLGSTDGAVHGFGIHATDNGTALPWSFTEGWRIPNPGGRFLLEDVHAYWTHEPTSLPVTVTATLTDSLGDSRDTVVERRYDLVTDDSHRVHFGSRRGTFLKVSHGASSSSTTVTCRGGMIRAWPRGLP